MEEFKAVIRPGLAVWAAVMLTLSFVLQIPMEIWIKAICVGILLEWVGERGVKKAKELFGGMPIT